MTADAEDLLRFREIIERSMGIAWDEARLPDLREILRRRLHARGLPCALYLAALDDVDAAANHERDALAAELTVGETYFFRHREQFEAFASVAVPDCLQARPQGISILSLGCASGEEPYSLAIIMRELQLERRVSITAVDINPVALAKAAAARYSPWSLRDTAAERQERWFQRDGRDFALDPSIRDMVRFERGNIADPSASLWRDGGHDIVFCRNILMYLAPEAIRHAVERIARSLRHPGYLFLGSAETLRGITQEFHLRHTHAAFYYQARDEAGPVDASRAPAQRRRTPWPAPAAPLDADGSWVDTIAHSSRRIDALADEGGKSMAAAGRTAPEHRPDLTQVVESLRAERYGEALDRLMQLPSHAAEDADALLLKAIAQVHAGEIAAAEGTCRALLARDDLNAGAHYLLALCREAGGDSAAAKEHDRMAAYLDPGFAMPRLHLGLLSRRAHEGREARSQLQDALILLQREEPARLLLFGGGFDRDALVGICRAELAACRDQR